MYSSSELANTLDITPDAAIVANYLRQGCNVLLTGGAGTGKTTILRQLIAHYQEPISLTASTGIAAVQIGGTTLHSWSGIKNDQLPAEHIAEYILSGPGTKYRRQLRAARILALDEISMISAELFEKLNQVLKIVRGSKLPFGGLQLLLVGDFAQLPPVTQGQAKPNFAFEAQAWQEADIKPVVLTACHRQNDARFIGLLEKLRFADLVNAELGLLKQREKFLSDNEPKTILTSLNQQVQTINHQHLIALSGDEHSYIMTGDGTEKHQAFLRQNCLAPETLTLKLGARVMMLKNTYQRLGIINGSLGQIVKFTGNYKRPIVRFDNDIELEIEPETWELNEMNPTTGVPATVASIKQFPLTLAWAITIHKSQGLTLNAALVDLTRVFAPGQVYVALSRLSNLEGLYLRGFDPNRVKCDVRVKKFYQSLV